MASIVIKVKFEEMLRRFNVAVKEDKCLDLNFEGLRLKIRALFNLPPESDFSLTYNDEDGDLVTLGDDDDLHDVVRQDLNPVRITVQLRSDQNSQSFSAPSSRSAAPIAAAPQKTQPNVAEVVKSVQETLGHVLMNLSSTSPNTLQNRNPDVAKILDSVKEPLTLAMSKLSLDVSSKSTSTSPILVDLFDGLSKIGQSCVNAALSGASGVSNHGSVGSSSKPESEGSKHEDSSDKEIKNADINTAVAQQSDPKITQATGVGASVKKPLCSSLSHEKGKNVSCESSSNKKSIGCGVKKGKITHVVKRGAGVSTDSGRAILTKASEKESYNNRMYVADVGGFPFSGMPLTHDQNFKQMGMGSIFHKGVRCDGCGVLPITGPRFKSKVKCDYDLCSICFSRMGNNVEYTRFNLPVANVHPWSFKVPDSQSFRQGVMRPHALLSKLDSRFILDVNVTDGATLAPLTPFTKIWRMRNNGTLPWNRGLQLICIGGDQFSRSTAVEIQVPSTGVTFGHDLDIAVDFIAPELPGRYISYWRMAESSNQMFGQRVWVQIQVDPSVDLTRESSPMLNLNLPPNSNETAIPELVDVKAEPNFTAEISESSPSSIPVTADVAVSVSATAPSLVPTPATSGDVTVSLLPPSSGSFPVGVTYPYISQVASTPFSLAEPSSISYYKDGTLSYPVREASAPYLPYPTISTLGESSIDRSNVQADNTNNNLEKAFEKALPSVSPSAASVNKPSSPVRDIFPHLLQEASAPLSPYSATRTHGELRTGASNMKNALSERASSSNLPPAVSANTPVSSTQPSSVSYPIVQTYPFPGILRERSPGASNMQNENSNQEQASEKVKFEEKLLKELAQMGFNQVDLNLEALRINEYDMGRAVEDLCDVSEWDPMLKELREMGFNNREINKRLLAKNNGSITRVVMDLIAEETP